MSAIETDDAELSSSVERHHFEKTATDRRGKGKAIRQATPGAWRQGLSGSEQAAALRIMGPTLTELGYGQEAARLTA